jgi:hypothetical protein
MSPMPSHALAGLLGDRRVQGGPARTRGSAPPSLGN